MASLGALVELALGEGDFLGPFFEPRKKRDTTEKQPTHFSLNEDAGTPATTRHLPGDLESRRKTTELALFVEEKSFLKDKEPCAESPHGSGRVRELIRIIDADFSKGRI